MVRLALHCFPICSLVVSIMTNSVFLGQAPSIGHMALTIAFLMATVMSAGAAMQDHFVGDLWLAQLTQNATAAQWREPMEAVSIIGRNFILIALALSLFAWFVWKNQRPEAPVVLGALLSLAINPMLKLAMDRPRPTDDLVAVWHDFGGLSFPSGHAFSALVLFGLLYYLTPFLVTRKPWANLVRVSSLLMILLIGISRVYLGAHWPSDVLGGFLFGLITLTFLVGFHRWLSGPDGQPRKAIA